MPELSKALGRALSLWLIQVSFCAAADIYISQTARGSDLGVSCDSSHSVDWFNNASSWGSAVARIGPGTRIHLCGNISTSLGLQGSGEPRKPIIVLFEQGASMRATVWKRAAINMDNRNYILIDGGVPCGLRDVKCNGVISNTDNSSSGQQVNGSVAISADACNHCEIRNIGIYNIYVHKGLGSDIDQSMVRCISYYGDHFRIHDSKMHDAGWCLVQDTANPNPAFTRIYNNDIYNVDHGFVLTLFGSATPAGLPAGPYFFYNNHVHDYAAWDTTANSYHHDGIHCFSTGGGPKQVAGAHINDLWIYNNVFDGDPGINLTGHLFLEAGVQTGGATPCMDATSRVHIFGNTFFIPRGRRDWNGIVDLGVHSRSDPLRFVDFYNNTVLGSDVSAADGTRGLVIENSAPLDVNVKNNVFGGANYLATIMPGSASDYNGYINCPSYNCWSGIPTLAAWSSSCACDRHSVESIHTMGGVTDGTGVLQPGSMMIEAGVNLSSYVSTWPVEQQQAIQTDRNGVSRGTGPWDIGALAFVSSPDSHTREQAGKSR